MIEPDYPATFTVHWVTGPTLACVKHARALVNLGRTMGVHVQATGAPEGSQCENCVNEAKAVKEHDDVR